MDSLSHPHSCGLIAIMIFAMTTYPLSQLFGSSKSSKHARPTAYATMPPNQDRYEVSLELVTIAGTEYAMQADLSQCEDVAELEDDILCFLPTVSDLDVFGCELDLLDLHTQQPLPEAFRTVLLQRPQPQIVVRLCMVDGHSIWQFQEDGKESYPKAVRVPANPRGEIADRAFHAALLLRHVDVAMGIQHVGFAAWQSCQQLQIVKLPPSVISLAEGTFQGCYVLREVAAPGCVQYSQGCLRSAAPQVELESVTKLRTATSWHQGHSKANMHSRVALRLQPSPLTWTILTNLERCLKVHFVGQALNSSVCRVISTISDRGPVKTAKDLWRSTSWAQKSPPYSLPPLPTV